MKNSLLLLISVFFIGCSQKKETPTNEPLKKKEKITSKSLENCDLIFQISQSEQSQAIQLATKSKYTHCGLIFNEGEPLVFEAIQPVKLTPLKEWIARGKDGHYVVKRLKNRDKLITYENYERIVKAGQAMTGKNYDLYFEWSDDRIYCSELIWKIYKSAGIELSKPEELGDFDLTHPSVKQKLKERYGNNIPMHEKVVSPAELFNSELLETVIEN